MVHPVPGSIPSAAFWQRGRSWSLDKDATGQGRHTGRDFAAPEGTPIRAATYGTVIAANAYDAAYGYKVIIRWGNFDVWYCHMPKNAAAVRVGQRVEAGERIGAVGDTGNVTGAHLHMELRHKGAGFAVASFLDPIRAVNYTPPPLRLLSLNLGDDNGTGKATRYERRSPLLDDLLSVRFDVAVLQEAPKDGVHAWLRSGAKKRTPGKEQGLRLIGGASGRYLWGRAGVTTLANLSFVPSIKGVGNKPKKVTACVVRIDGYRRRLVVNVHGPYGIGRKRKRLYWREVWAQVERWRKAHDLERWQVVVGGDTNGVYEAKAEAKRYGYVSAAGKARKVVGGKWATTNGWKPRYRLGQRIDRWFVHESVTVLEYRNMRTRSHTRGTKATTDHNRQFAAIA